MSSTNDPDNIIQVVLSSKVLNDDINFLSEIGFRLDNIYPADDPAVAILSGFGISLMLDVNETFPNNKIRILTDNQELLLKKQCIAPNGTIFEYHSKSYKLESPETQHKFEVRQLSGNDSWIIGRAGMLYRDLIPDRLGGSIIASHINIPEGGPVPDVVHYHTIGFQLIFCYKGWVKLVYEDQGPPFILNAGDCVTQPPEIRHRVLEASDNLEVIEIGVPADHMTTIDHEMELPTENYHPNRKFHGQVFCHHLASEASWGNWRIPGFIHRDTGVNQATQNIASVHVVKPSKSELKSYNISHDTDILFGFIMKGGMDLFAENQGIQSLNSGDAFVIPPNLKYQFINASEDLEFLEVALPGQFNTKIHNEKS